MNSLVGAIADLAGEERVRNHVSKAFKQKLEPEQPRAIFASIAEKTIQLSKKVTDNRRLYESCSRVLGKSLDLLPTADLVKSAELLLENADSQVQVAAIKSVEIRAGSVIQNDHQSVSALLEFLPRVDAVLMRSQVMDVKIIAVSCIDRIIERFGKKDVSAVAAVSQTVAGPQALASADDRIRILSLLCLTSIVDVLEDEAIALLPTILPKSFQYLESAIAQENTGLHNAVYTLLSNIVERLGFMFSREYLVPVLKLSQRSAAAALDDACDESRSQFWPSKNVSDQQTICYNKHASLHDDDGLVRFPVVWVAVLDLPNFDEGVCLSQKVDNSCDAVAEDRLSDQTCGSLRTNSLFYLPCESSLKVDVTDHVC